ncbi:MAG: hypothetical protein AB1600_11720 [Bacteroidota bacterium]
MKISGLWYMHGADIWFVSASFILYFLLVTEGDETTKNVTFTSEIRTIRSISMFQFSIFNALA